MTISQAYDDFVPNDSMFGDEEFIPDPAELLIAEHLAEKSRRSQLRALGRAKSVSRKAVRHLAKKRRGVLTGSKKVVCIVKGFYLSQKKAPTVVYDEPVIDD